MTGQFHHRITTSSFIAFVFLPSHSWPPNIFSNYSYIGWLLPWPCQHFYRRHYWFGDQNWKEAWWANFLLLIQCYRFLSEIFVPFRHKSKSHTTQFWIQFIQGMDMAAIYNKSPLSLFYYKNIRPLISCREGVLDFVRSYLLVQPKTTTFTDTSSFPSDLISSTSLSLR